MAKQSPDAVFSKELLARPNEVLLRIGSEVFTRKRLSSILEGVGNVRAMYTVIRTLKKLNVETKAGLKALDPMSLLTVEGFGESCLWVTMHLVHEVGLDMNEWFGWDGLKSSPKRWETLRREKAGKARKHKKKHGAQKV